VRALAAGYHVDDELGRRVHIVIDEKQVAHGRRAKLGQVHAAGQIEQSLRDHIDHARETMPAMPALLRANWVRACGGKGRL
jgi:hypothetical protein